MSNQILVPTLGESITEATVSKWLKQVGDTVDADEPVVELESDKINLELPSPISGTLSSIKVKEGDTVEVGALLGEVNEGQFTKTENTKFYWCQEEPQNMGAWNSARNYIEWTLKHIGAEDTEVRYIGRKPAASPATGYIKRHIDQQKQIVEKVLS